MKYYNVTEAELNELATLSVFGTFFIALGSLLAGFSWDMWITFGVQPLENEEVGGLISNLRTFMIVCAAASLFIGFGLVGWRFRRRHSIMNETIFD